MLAAYIYLSLAIVAEVAATLSLPLTQEFSKLIPSAFVMLAYLVSMYFMTLSMRFIPVGTVYAIWSAVGIVLVMGGDYLLYQQKQDIAALVGTLLIISGVVVINVFSATATHR